MTSIFLRAVTHMESQYEYGSCLSSVPALVSARRLLSAATPHYLASRIIDDPHVFRLFERASSSTMCFTRRLDVAGYALRIAVDAAHREPDGAVFIDRIPTRIERLGALTFAGIDRDLPELDARLTAVLRGVAHSLEELAFLSCASLRAPVLAPVASMRLLRSLNLQGCGAVDESALEYVVAASALSAHRNLSELDLSECVGVGDGGARLIGKLTSLVSLSLSSTTVSDAGVAYLAPLTRLRKLRLDRLLTVGDAAADVVSANLTVLQTLSMETCNMLTGAGLALICQRMQTLESLSVKWCTSIGNDGIAALRYIGPHLRNLNLFNLDAASPESFAACAFGELTGLEVLDLSWCHVDASAFAVVPPAMAARLHTLSLDGCGNATDALMWNLRGLSALRDLTVHGRRLTDRAIALLAGVSLEDIAAATATAAATANDSVGQSALLCRAVAAAAAASPLIRGLERLKLTHMTHMNSMGPNHDLVIAPLSRCSNLTELDTGWLMQVTDAGVELLVASEHSPRGLTKLNVSTWESVTEAGMRTIARHLPDLTELDLSLTRVTDDIIADFVARCPRLSDLCLAGCDDLTNDTFDHLLSLRSLTQLNVCSCTWPTGLLKFEKQFGCGLSVVS